MLKTVITIICLFISLSAYGKSASSPVVRSPLDVGGLDGASRKTIYIYNDEGVGSESLKQTERTLLELTNGKYEIKTINAAGVIAGNWAHNASLFVMPGGADLPYKKKLSGDGNRKIKEYVENGGSYLGLCAGGYYGASYVEFDKDGELEVLGGRELGFFPGPAIGPLVPYDYKTNSGARAGMVIAKDKEFPLYYNGGAYFKNASYYNHVEVLASYDFEELPAVIGINYGSGKVVLSGAHFEYNPSSMDKNDKYLTEIIPTLAANNQSRIDFVKNILVYLNI